MTNGPRNTPNPAEDAEKAEVEHKTVRDIAKALVKSFHPDAAQLPEITPPEEAKDAVRVLTVINGLFDVREEKLRLRRWPSVFDPKPGITKVLYYGRSRKDDSVRGPAVGILPNTPNAFFMVLEEFLKTGKVPDINEVPAAEGVHELEGPILEVETFDDVANMRKRVMESPMNDRTRVRLMDLLSESLGVIARKKAEGLSTLADLQTLRNDTHAFIKGRGDGLMYTDSIVPIEQQAKKLAEGLFENAKSISEVEEILQQVNTYTFSAPSVYKTPLFEVGAEKISESIYRSMKNTKTESGYESLKAKVMKLNFAENADEKRAKLISDIEKHQERYPDYKNKVLTPKSQE